MQTTTRAWIHQMVDQLPGQEMEHLRTYLEFLTWRAKQQKAAPQPTGKNVMAQRIIKAMEQPPYVTHEDIEELLRVIKEGKQPTRFESPFEQAVYSQRLNARMDNDSEILDW